MLQVSSKTRKSFMFSMTDEREDQTVACECGDIVPLNDLDFRLLIDCSHALIDCPLHEFNCCSCDGSGSVKRCEFEGHLVKQGTHGKVCSAFC